MPTLINTLNSLSERLKDYDLSSIAKASGVHVNTVRAIKNKSNKNPTIVTLDKLWSTLDAIEGVEND